MPGFDRILLDAPCTGTGRLKPSHPSLPAWVSFCQRQCCTSRRNFRRRCRVLVVRSMGGQGWVSLHETPPSSPTRTLQTYNACRRCKNNWVWQRSTQSMPTPKPVSCGVVTAIPTSPAYTGSDRRRVLANFHSSGSLVNTAVCWRRVSPVPQSVFLAPLPLLVCVQAATWCTPPAPCQSRRTRWSWTSC